MIALATCLNLPEPDLDQPHLDGALVRAGVDARLVAWDDPSVDWAAFRAVVIRSTWDYFHRASDFERWADAVASVTRLANPAPVVRWNAHKRYMLQLEAAGVPVVPTAILPAGSPNGRQVVADALARWPVVVIKPAVSAGSFATVRVADEEAGAAHLAAHLGGRDLLVQPYMDGVDGSGERCLVWIDGAFTHAVRKRARFADDHEDTAVVPIEADERALAERVLACAPGPLLYARVDLVRDGEGRPRLMELELIEPSLFLRHQPSAADRLAACLAHLG